MIKQIHQQLGFTLAELLIALAILGVIATFTIPKILETGSNAKFNSIAKESAGFMSEAYMLYKSQNTVTASTWIGDLTPYINYVKRDTTILIDRYPGGTFFDCSIVNEYCLLLHNGAVIRYAPESHLGGTEPTNAMFFEIDPDGVYSGSASGPGKSPIFILYKTGMLRTWGTMEPNTFVNNGLNNPLPSLDPSWFSWGN